MNKSWSNYQCKTQTQLRKFSEMEWWMRSTPQQKQLDIYHIAHMNIDICCSRAKKIENTLQTSFISHRSHQVNVSPVCQAGMQLPRWTQSKTAAVLRFFSVPAFWSVDNETYMKVQWNNSEKQHETRTKKLITCTWSSPRPWNINTNTWKLVLTKNYLSRNLSKVQSPQNTHEAIMID